jgi:hypothetical protein
VSRRNSGVHVSPRCHLRDIPREALDVRVGTSRREEHFRISRHAAVEPSSALSMFLRTILAYGAFAIYEREVTDSQNILTLNSHIPRCETQGDGVTAD